MNENRRSIRLRGYDYSQAGAYFITVCTQNMECLFGEIVTEEMVLNNAGYAALQCWQTIPDHFPHAELDAFIVMPNHVHGIVVIVNRRGTACRARDDGGLTMGTACRARDDGGLTMGTACRAPTTPEKFGHPVAGSIPTIMRSFKSAATKRINEMYRAPGDKLWQRNYYEHVIRNDDELNRIREYIINNPAQWDLDRENPSISRR